MEREAICTVRYGADVFEAKALLGGQDLCFQGDFQRTIPFTDVTAVEVADGELQVTFSGGRATFEFEQAGEAEIWAATIRNPRRLIDTLDVKPGARVALLGVSDPEFLIQLRARTELVLEHDLVRNLDLIFVQIDDREGLDQIAILESFLHRTGAIWIIVPTGTHATHITEMDVLNGGCSVGLADTTVANFSATHTAHKFVIPPDRL